ncbi:unnamed protein product [Choristocarpus tenellus]
MLRGQRGGAVAWSWSCDLAGAKSVRSLPNLTRKGTYSFIIDLGQGKKPVILAVDSPQKRDAWIRVLDAARDVVTAKDFTPLSVIGEGHFGKVLLVRRKMNSLPGSGGAAGGRSFAETPTRPPSTSSSVLPSPSSTSTPRIEGVRSTSSLMLTESSTKAAVFRPRSEGHGLLLAVKEVALTRNSSLQGVLNERQILGSLPEHPFVVTLQCAWRRGDFLYYGLDFMPGADLFEVFKRVETKMTIESTRVYAGQILLALEHLHAHGIVYRDLKPENILVDQNGHLRLADMGLSKRLGPGTPGVLLARTTTVCGTRAYLAPEMIKRTPYGLSVDYWQFGCFIFELYAGHSPFWTPRTGNPARANDQTAAIILGGEVAFPKSMEPAARDIVRALLKSNVNDRLGCKPAATVRPPAQLPEAEAAANAICASSGGLMKGARPFSLGRGGLSFSSTLKGGRPSTAPPAALAVAVKAVAEARAEAAKAGKPTTVLEESDSAGEVEEGKDLSTQKTKEGGGEGDMEAKSVGEEGTKILGLLDRVCSSNNIGTIVPTVMPAVPAAPSSLSGWALTKTHHYFDGLDWEALLRKEVPAPVKPGDPGRSKVGNFSREYTRHRARWGGDVHEMRGGGPADKMALFRQELIGFDFVRK